MLREVRYRQELERLYEDPNDRDARLATIESVINALGRYEERNKKPTMNDFLDELALAERDDQSDGSSKLDSNAVKLLTIHSAKGLEFPDVYLAGVEEGILPHRKSVESGDQSIEEERRLCYVAVTRAQQRLTLSLALPRLKWGKSRPTQPSRFLYELTGTADRFDNKKPSPKGKARPKATRKKKRSRG